MNCKWLRQLSCMKSLKLVTPSRTSAFISSSCAEPRSVMMQWKA